MIFPIGHESSEVRRTPWVTFAIMATCLLALLATDPLGSSASAPATSPVEEAARYWRDHPYLDAPPEVLTEVGYDVAPNQRKQYIGLLRTNAQPPEDKEQIEAEQAELDAILAGELSAEGAAPAESPYQRWGLRGDSPTLLGFFTHMFMHAGWFHLLGNMFMLFLAGPALEDRWGRPLYAAFYLLSGLFSGAFFLVVHRTNLPLVGASGAIAGVLGAFLVRYAKTQIRFGYLFFLGLRFFRGTFMAPAWAALPLWFGNELLAASIGRETGVANWAHVGGFAFGVAAGFAIRQLRLEERFVADAIDAKITVRGNPAVEAALALREAGDAEGAFAKLREEVRRSPQDCDAAMALWATAGALGREEEARPALSRAIKQLATREPATAAQWWLELCEQAPAARLDPPTLLSLHDHFAAAQMDAEAKRALRHAADPQNPALTPALALRVLEAARPRDAQAAAAALRFVLAAPQVAEEKKAKLRTQLAELEASLPPPEEAQPAPRRRTEPIDIGPLEDEPAPLAQPHEEPAAYESESTFDAAQLARDGDESGESADTEAGFVPADAETDPSPSAALPEPEGGGKAELAVDDRELGALLGVPRFQGVKATDAVPSGLDERGVVMSLSDGRSGRIAFEKIQAIAVAAVGGLGPRPVVVVDLLLNWNALEESELRLVRMRSDGFDAARLVPGSASPLAALQAFLGALFERTGAAPLPDADAARAAPLRRFADLETYQREVLEAGS